MLKSNVYLSTKKERSGARERERERERERNILYYYIKFDSDWYQLKGKGKTGKHLRKGISSFSANQD